MNILYFLVGCSLFMALVFLLAFFWASKTGQHEDTCTPAIRMLLDDELKKTDEDQVQD
ncbi:cbb3-type cytochrome oxidase assembly protein CcoS [Pedobacter yulinensis]|uniref:Cbb3-type cytochrome oxidase assembly protein CcoS n=1 Tax=Pedobacter yulinensis TaxID=2126353 RepID=A0A2T3HK08_9SPHI|nr:cbb3-type cytochrome oxidase assembly protein CcoS [Pedobacter yulinensis]PST82766.1 cbb3-type cytochrome oxidase assembly protein CcoS [Pedobacter yulinensis]